MTAQHVFFLTRNSYERDVIDDEALDIVVRLMSGAATVVDGAAIRRWRHRSPSHIAAFDEAIRLWRGLEQAARTAAAAEDFSGVRPGNADPAAADIAPSSDRAASAVRRLQGHARAGAFARRKATAAKKVALPLRKLPPRSV